MTDNNLFEISERVNKKDLQLILEVNKKVVQLEMETATQNEDIIELLNKLNENDVKFDIKLDKAIKQNEDISKDIFKLQVLLATGMLSLILQIIQLFVKK